MGAEGSKEKEQESKQKEEEVKTAKRLEEETAKAESEKNRWRTDTLTQWKEKDRDELMEKIRQLSGSVNSEKIRFFRIIFVGHMGAGKSSLINAFNSALRGRVVNTAIEGGLDHTTKQFMEYPTKDDRGNKLMFSFCDIRGLGHSASGSSTVDVLKAICGQKKVGEEMDPRKESEDRDDDFKRFDKRSSFMIVYVMDGSAHLGKKEAGEADSWLPQVLNLKTKTDGWGIFGRALVVTHMDKLDSSLEDTINRIHHSTTANTAMSEIVSSTGFPMKCVFPVVCPVKHVNEIPVQFQVHLLFTLHSILQDAVDMYEQRQFTEGRNDEYDD